MVADAAERAPEACAPLTDPNLRGDCALLVAARRLASGASAQEACGAVPPGAWADECWFQAAEVALAADRDGHAAALCRKAGAFAADCAQHLWQGPLHALATREARDPAALQAAATRLHGRWAKHQADPADFDRRFWSQAWQAAAVTAGIDLGRCDALSEGARAPCRAAQVELFERELAPALARGRVELCALPPTAAAVRPWLPAEPPAAFDSVVAARAAEVCR